MRYISYYTKNTPYEEVMKTHLLASLQRLELKYDIESIENLGSWRANTHFKATFIKKMLLKHKKSVCFLDSDVTIEQKPILFEKLNNYDIAYHKLDWFKFWRKQEGNPKREALSGTLYLKYNEKILKFLDEWIELNKISTDWEQRNMQKILEKWKGKLQTYNLPPEYCCIIMRNGAIPKWYVKEKPIIIHHQVSRKYKNENR